jgi:phage recombination protein Bet
MSTQALTVVTPQYEDPQMLDTIKQTVCKGATDAQFRMFVEVCRATGLNPFLKEIWYVPSVGVMAGRDGYLRKANEHPQFDGMETRVERDEKNIPIKAVCTVWRKDRNHPVIAEAYYNEYRKGGNVWQTYPSAMIAKVAEVLALKRSFTINGVVTEEEIGNAEERGSKEAQAEYLASKGLEPYVAPPKQLKERTGTHELRETPELPPATKPEVIRELDALLDSTPDTKGRVGPDRTIEMRHASTVAAAEEVLKDTAKPGAKRKRGGVSFDVLKHFGEVKKLIIEATGTSDAYYTTLKQFGYEHADAITDNDEARNIYKALALFHKNFVEDKKLRTELELAHSIHGKRFMDVLGANGATSIDDVLGMDSEHLEVVRKELKELGHGQPVA